MTGQPTFIRAGTDDAGWAADLIGRTFHPLEVARWLVPDMLGSQPRYPRPLRVEVPGADIDVLSVLRRLALGEDRQDQLADRRSARSYRPRSPRPRRGD